jgi:hypothetical protein
LSNGRTRAPHFGQCDGGEIKLIPSGTRQITTLKKLPNAAPKTAIQPTKIAKNAAVIAAFAPFIFVKPTQNRRDRQSRRRGSPRRRTEENAASFSFR